MSNKLNKIGLKGLNPRILKDEGLNWFKVSKWTNSKIHLKLRDQKLINEIGYILFFYNKKPKF